MSDIDNKGGAQRAEENAVRQLGDAIGYGRIMQLAGKLWRDALVRHGHPPGGEFTIGPCAGSMVACPCPEDGRDDNGHCEWCCGAGQVTERVRVAMGRPRAVPLAATAIAPSWRKAPPTVDEARAGAWWWHRAPGVEPRVLRFDVATYVARGDVVVLGVVREHVIIADGPFVPAEWGGADAEWAPCLAPSEGGRTP